MTEELKEEQQSIKVSELFYSLQGEGRYMGVPSVFLRTFGCNFKCQGFGMPKGQLSEEAEKIAQDQKNGMAVESYDDLPLVTTGCDSYASWHPAFKSLSPVLTTDEIVDRIVDLLPNKQWGYEHLVITGGEPLLGWQRSYIDLLKNPKMLTLKELTFETNGTQPIYEKFRYFLFDWMLSPKYGRRGNRAVTFSVSPKLSCSGEPRDKAIRPDIVCSYEAIAFTYLKYVIATEEDALEALEVTELYRKEGFKGPIYFMPLGGVNDMYTLNNHKVAELAMKYGIRYSDRMHLPLFGNRWGT